MSDCCDITPGISKAKMQSDELAPLGCPSCRDGGRVVEHRTMLQTLKPDRFEQLGNHKFHFCQTPTCPVIYYSTDSEVAFSADDLRVEVGLKRQGDPSALVCYCFGYTEGMIADDLRASGETVIPHKITELTRIGICACEVRNPAGMCCLGQVSKAVKRLSEEYRSVAELTLAPPHGRGSR